MLTGAGFRVEFPRNARRHQNVPVCALWPCVPCGLVCLVCLVAVSQTPFVILKIVLPLRGIYTEHIHVSTEMRFLLVITA